MKYKLGELIESISYTFDNSKSQVVLINTSDIFDGKVLNHSLVKNWKLKGQFKKSFQQFDILYSEIRPKNKRYAYIEFDSKDYVASTKLMVIRTSSSLINSKFLFHLLKSKNTINELQMLAESRSGTFPQITFNEIANLEKDIPSVDIQKKIINILDSIEDKILLNNKLNDNLECLVKELYNQWFNLFEFINNDEESYISSGGLLQETKLGKIPIEFKVGTMQEIIKFSNGKKKPLNEGNIPIYGGNGILGYAANSNHENVIVIGRVGAYCGSLILEPFQCWVSDNAIAAKPITGEIYYSYQLLKNFNLNNMHIGSSQPLLTQGILNSIEIIVPPKYLIKKFNNLVEPLYKKIFSIRYENEKLALARDTLLPKLMSGEICLENLNI